MSSDKFEEQIKAISKESWDKLFSLIPEIESTNSFGKWEGGNKLPDGSMQFPYVRFSDLIGKFLDVVYELNIILNFDWSNWDEGRKIIRNEKTDFNKLDVVTICKLITAIVRKDRFCEGVLLGSFEDGTILKMLKGIKGQIK